MPTLAWRPGPAARHVADDTVVMVMASRFQLTTIRAVPAFFAASISAWRQALRSEECVGVSLKALPLSREFWTLSAWMSKDAIYGYAGTEPHARGAKRQTRSMASSTFVFWETTRQRLPIPWPEAKRRVLEQIARNAKGTT